MKEDEANRWWGSYVNKREGRGGEAEPSRMRAQQLSQLGCGEREVQDASEVRCFVAGDDE